MVKEIRFCKFKRLAMWTKWEIRYRRGPSQVQNMRAVQKTGFCGTRRVFRSTRCAKQAPVVRDAFSEEHCTGKGLFLSGVCCIRCRQCSPFSGSLKNSVPERAFSGTEYACCAKKGFLRYATRFLKPSVLKTGFWGTEEIFGTGNALLRYGMHHQSAVLSDLG